MLDSFERLGVPRNASASQIHRAYLELARRWHPDRFPEGPERLYAEKNMIEINVAYEEASKQGSFTVSGEVLEGEQLKIAKRLMDIGQLTAARRALMGAKTRCAEWNYMFGAVLLRLGELEKAALYFGVASRQRPEVGLYRTALSGALAISQGKRRTSIFKKLKISGGQGKKAAFGL